MQVKPYVGPKKVMQAILVWLSRLALPLLPHRLTERKFRNAQICFGRGTCAALVRAVGACTLQPCVFMSVVLVGKNDKKKRSSLESMIGEVVPQTALQAFR